VAIVGKTPMPKLLSWCDQIQVADRADLSTNKTEIIKVYSPEFKQK